MEKEVVKFVLKRHKRLCNDDHTQIKGEDTLEIPKTITHQAHQHYLLEDVRTKVDRLREEGNVLAEAAKYRAAMVRWLEAINIDNKDGTIYELLAQASMAIYEDFHAIQFASQATLLCPMWSEGFQTLSRCQLNYGEVKLAHQNITKAIELVPNDNFNLLKELLQEKQEILQILGKQKEVILKREAEEEAESNENRLQAIACLKHLAHRAQTR